MIESLLNNSEIIKKPIFNSNELAPRDFFSRKMNVPKELIFNLLNLWQEAILSFLNGDIRKHDALVGENSCQIRAAFLLDMLSDENMLLSNHQLILVIDNIKNVILCLNKIDISREDMELSIADYFIKYNMTFYIPEHILPKIQFIINAYILTLTKEQLPSDLLTLRERTSYSELFKLGFVKNKARSLVSNTQKLISEASCNYIINESKYLESRGLSFLLQVKKDSHERSFLPQFFSAKVIIQRMIDKNQYILLAVNRYVENIKHDKVNFLFKPNPITNDFEICYEKLVPSYCLVAEGAINYDRELESIDEFTTRLLSYSVKSILLSNFAIHPQYPGEYKDLPPPFSDSIESLHNLKNENVMIDKLIEEIKYEEFDYINKKEYAINEGFCLANPSSLFLNHIYCDATKNHKIYRQDSIDLNITSIRYDNNLIGKIQNDKFFLDNE